MSKGRRNREISYRQEKDKEVKILRELNSHLIARMEGMHSQIMLLAKENEHARAMSDTYGKHKSRIEEERLTYMASENAELRRQLHFMGCKYKELEAKGAATERGMMYKLCDMERRHEESLMVCMKMASSFQEEKMAIQEENKRILEKNSEDRRAGKEREEKLERIVCSLKQDLRTVLEERENSERACLQLKNNNKVLARHIIKEDDMRKKGEEDLKGARKAIEALFSALRTRTDDLDAGQKERKTMEERIRSLEGELRASERDHAITRTKFENLKESGAWTGVLLNRQDDRIAHLTESLLEERRRVKDTSSRVEKCMDQLTAERREKNATMLDLSRLHEERRVLMQGLVSAREDLGDKELKIQGLELQVQALRNEVEALKCSAEKEEVRILVGRLCEAQKESEVLLAHNGELGRENESIKHEYLTLKREMKERMVKLKKTFLMIEGSHAQRTGKG